MVIILVFAVYHFAGQMDMAGEVKRSELEESRISAEIRKEEVLLESKKLDIQMGRLAIEAKKLGLEYTPPEETDVEYRFLEDDKKKKGSK